MIVCVPLVSVHVPQHSYAFIYFLSIIHGLKVLVVLCVCVCMCLCVCVGVCLVSSLLYYSLIRTVHATQHTYSWFGHSLHGLDR